MLQLSGICNGLPVVVVLAYFLIAWTESFPLLAYTTLMREEMKMSLPMQTNFYAVTFFPWMWKPIYGLISDCLPIAGYHRKPYIAMAALLSCLSYLVTGFFVHSVPAFWAVTLCRAVGNAFLQLMLGSFLVDRARKELDGACGLQATANAAKWAGTLVADIMGLIVYANGEAAVGTRGAIALGGVGTGLVVILAFFVPEERDNRSIRTMTMNPDSLRFGLTIFLVQANLIIVSIKDMVSWTWWHWLIPSVCVSMLLIALMWYSEIKSRVESTPDKANDELLERNSELERPQVSQIGWVTLCAFCFLVTTIPKGATPMYNYNYSVFTASAQQQMTIIGDAATLLAAYIFGKTFNRRALLFVFLQGIALAALLALSPLVFVLQANADDAVAGAWIHGTTQLNSSLGLIAVATSVLGSFGGIAALLPVDSLVTTSAASLSPSRSASAYAVQLSLYAFGGSVAGFISAPILSAMGLGGDPDWSRLPLFLLLGAGLQLLVLPMLFLVPRSLLRISPGNRPPAQPLLPEAPSEYTD